MTKEIDKLQDEYVLLFQPVLVRRSEIHCLPMLMPPSPPQVLSQEPLISRTAVPINAFHSEHKERKGRASEKQIDFVTTIGTRSNMTAGEICKSIGIKNLSEMTNAQANEFISKYKDAKPQLF